MVFFKKNNIIRLIRKIEEKIRLEESYINGLDSKIGDGDHGSNMANSLAKMRELVTSEDSDDLGKIINIIGESFLISGGGMGPYLYGSSIKEASSIMNGKDIITLGDFILILEKIDDSIKKLGNVNPGDKTMYDVIHQITNFLNKADKKENSILVLGKIANVAEDAMLYTKHITAQKGRASLFGDRSIGNIDPGAYSMYLIFSVIFEFYKDERILEFLQKE